MISTISVFRVSLPSRHPCQHCLDGEDRKTPLGPRVTNGSLDKANDQGMVDLSPVFGVTLGIGPIDPFLAQSPDDGLGAVLKTAT
jgi:hypothetical protein